jgi:hypothetical protein
LWDFFLLLQALFRRAGVLRVLLDGHVRALHLRACRCPVASNLVVTGGGTGTAPAPSPPPKAPPPVVALDEPPVVRPDNDATPVPEFEAAACDSRGGKCERQDRPLCDAPRSVMLRAVDFTAHRVLLLVDLLLLL